jgi:hypothetical protein
VSITGTARVTCPTCGRACDAELVQSINTAKDAEARRRLLAGELNVLACACGKRTPLAASLLFHDPDRDFYARVVPEGDERAIDEAEAQFRAAGATGALRVVRSLNALAEKVKILEAGLEDWAIEMTKVLLLSTIGDLDRVLLFSHVEADVLHWLLFDAQGGTARPVASPRAAYERIAARAASRPPPNEVQIDRSWAVTAVQAMIAAGN